MNRYLRTLLRLKIDLPLRTSYGSAQGSFCSLLYYLAYRVGLTETMINISDFACPKQYTDWDNVSGSLPHKLDVSLYFETGLVYCLDKKVKAIQKRSLQLIARRSPLLTVDFYRGLVLYELTNNVGTELMVANATEDCIYHSITQFPSIHRMHSGIKMDTLYGGKRRYYCR